MVALSGNDEVKRKDERPQSPTSFSLLCQPEWQIKAGHRLDSQYDFSLNAKLKGSSFYFTLVLVHPSLNDHRRE